MSDPYNRATANTTDRIAWVLCQIIDDDAPAQWTRYRFAAECIARNEKVMADLNALASLQSPEPARSCADGCNGCDDCTEYGA